MSQLDREYDDFIGTFQKALGKIDVALALRTLYLERKLAHDEKPKVELYICYRAGVDLDKKKYELNEFFPCLSTTTFKNNRLVPDCERVIKVECLTDLKTIHEMSKDDDIEHVSGAASLGSY